MKNIYLDNAATTPIDPRVFDAMLPGLRDEFGNPSSAHAHGRSARAAVEKAREHVAQLLGADASEMVFTSGGTESDNAAIHMMLGAAGGTAPVHFLTSQAEHHAIMQPLEQLEERSVRVDFIGVDSSAVPRLDHVAASFSGDEQLHRCMSLMHVNNETGGILDLQQAAAIADSHSSLIHSDMVQSAGKLPIAIHDLHVDFASLSAHKIHGPKGAGALYIRKGMSVDPMMVGGSQERGRRGGTENLIGIIGLGEAARLAVLEMDERHQRWSTLKMFTTERLGNVFPDIVINGDGDAALPNICSVTFPADAYPMDGELITARCDLSGLSVSSGSACTAGSVIPSHVMKAIGHDDASSISTVRLSYGAQTTEDEVRRGVEVLIEVIQDMLDRSSPLSHSRTAMP